jgi:4,5-DOPA dioxygenase extradiol
MARTPSLFVSHGAPSLALEDGPSRDFLASLGTRLGKPRAIVCVSAHWETPAVNVGLAAHPETIHDFYGFPPELYRLRYPAAGDPALGRRVLQLLPDAGIPSAGDETRGFDHGVWSPLILIYPGADIPVVEISVQSRLDAGHHLKVGRALAPLRDEGVLIMGSGSTTHNLREIGRTGPDGGPPGFYAAFEKWVCDAVTEGRTKDLEAFERLAPYAQRNHPTPEHFLPLFAPLGAAGDGARGEVLNRHFELGTLSMAAFLWV